MTTTLYPFAAMALPSLGVIAIAGKRGSGVANSNYPGLWTVNVSTGASTDRGALDTTHTATAYVSGIAGPITNGRVPVAYETSGGVYYADMVLNSAPYAPTLTVSAAAFPALEGVDITITHNDPDDPAGTGGGAYRLKRVKTSDGTTDYWSVAAGNFVGVLTDNEAVGPAYTITATSNAGEWTSGETYTLYPATRDTSGEWGPYSSGTVVTPGTRPVAGLTSPGSTVTSGTVTAQGTSTQPVSAYRYELLDGAGTTTLEDGGWVSGTSIPSKTFAYALVNSTGYKVRFTVRNQTGAGIDSLSVTQAFATSFTPVGAVTGLTLTENAAEAKIALAWTAPGGAISATSYTVQRSANGGTSYTDLATVTVTSYTDYSPASGVSYLYRVVAVGSNGTQTTSGTVAGSVSWTDWVFRPVDGSDLLTFSAGPARAPWTQGQAINVPETQSRYRREYVGQYQARTVDLSAMFGHGEETAFETREYLRTLVLDRAEGWLKSPSGDVLRGKLQSLSGEIRLPTQWEDLRVGFRETRGAI
jgi:hypothetical protein